MKYDLLFDPPLMNAAGTLGFAPDPHGPVDLARLGAFITNPVSLAPRSPAHTPRCLSYPGGFLLHTGYPNPGLERVMRTFGPRWERSTLPVLVHLLAGDPLEVARMVSRLEELPGITGFEVGLPPEVDALTAVEFARAAAGELPVVLRLPMRRAPELAPALVGAGLAALSLAPPRGALPGPQGALARGRLYGPALFPLTLQALHDLEDCGLPVFAAGGVYHPGQVASLLAAGAVAVQLDAVLWREGWK
jgi:dihydroorotate dehydrogenase (NAD+) catalytic subunit